MLLQGCGDYVIFLITACTEMIAMLIFDWLDNVVHALVPGDLNE